MANKKYYWLKLQKDFFKRHDIRIIEDMPNGKDYILFYLKLLVESIDHEGRLRFSNTIPYNEQMLSIVTNTNIDIVRSAMKIFTELEMIEVLEDSTIFMIEVEKMIGSSNENDYQRENHRLRQQKYREKKKDEIIEASPLRHGDVIRDVEIEIEKEIEIEIDKKEKNKKEKNVIPPSFEMVDNYCSERNNGIDAQCFIDFYDSKGWYVGKNKMVDWQATVRTWERKNTQGYGNNQIIRDKNKNDRQG